MSGVNGVCAVHNTGYSIAAPAFGPDGTLPPVFNEGCGLSLDM